MSVWDWVECGLIDKHIELPAMTGSFGVTIGDAVAGFFGARHTHIFGADVKLVADPEDLLLGQLEHALPLVTALLGGVGGNVTFCYGTNLTATYMGPKMEIRRAKNISKTTDYYFKSKAAPAAGGAPPPPDPVDPATLAAVSVLSILVVCVPAALELAIRFKYPQYGVKGASEETLEGYGKAPGVLKLCAYMVTSRLMALLKMIEDAGSLAQSVRNGRRRRSTSALDSKRRERLPWRSLKRSLPLPGEWPRPSPRLSRQPAKRLLPSEVKPNHS
jgi:hypothetical protein